MQTTEFLNSLFATRNAHHAANSADAADAAYAPPSPHPHTRARPQPLARTRSRYPLAVCTRCTNFSFTADRISEKCGRVGNGRTCTGVFTSTLNSSEWQHCTACYGTGWHGAVVCMHCQSLGWRFFRRH